MIGELAHMVATQIMAAMIDNAKRLTFRDIARAALEANGLDADEVLKELVGGERVGTLMVKYEGTTFEFKMRGISLNFELMARLQGETEWLEVAFLSDH